ncbi:hypothetical protein [Solitalea canadensis]|uniref:Substrate import-associated zinc metallohydrolase lipoprotein n=1 Tax=Solitalea canadensis (strain ATCC 29591 / DSM 3403 / JCM 21819 / LMG 8368 / NBRC 15130 / NCIMB 12057 / USAM 9D) TaxID=929556 RepID=H8KM39_SOLCM|nr:hypothetical protein [Solitalea canadensis]AFD08961.1 hypothetical protein Solca_3968 [Solitalea canadensis DSM 3403]
MTSKRLLAITLLSVALVNGACKKEEIIRESATSVQTLEQNNLASAISITKYKVVGESLIKVANYKVPDSLVKYQNDEYTHQKMWQYFTTLIPAEYRTRIKQFDIVYGNQKVTGYVSPLSNKLNEWKLALAIEYSGDLNKINLRNQGFAYTVIHELGHVLTLNEEQLDPSTSSENCKTFRLSEGCPRDKSYIFNQYKLGWTDILAENTLISADDDDALAGFYNKYQDRFVTPYAATNVVEDIAETFTSFVLYSKPNGNTIREQKVKLMYTEPALVELRNSIRTNPSVLALTPAKILQLSKEFANSRGKVIIE